MNYDLPDTHMGICVSHLPAEIDPAEPEVKIHFIWYRGEKPDATSPGCDESVEIQRVICNSIDIWPDHDDPESEAEQMWMQRAWDNVALWKDWVDGQHEERAIRRQEIRIDLKGGA